MTSLTHRRRRPRPAIATAAAAAALLVSCAVGGPASQAATSTAQGDTMDTTGTLEGAGLGGEYSGTGSWEAAPGTSAAPRTDLTTPQEAVRALLTALEAMDETTVWALTSRSSRYDLEADPGASARSRYPTVTTMREYLAALGTSAIQVGACQRDATPDLAASCISAQETYACSLSTVSTSSSDAQVVMTVAHDDTVFFVWHISPAGE